MPLFSGVQVAYFQYITTSLSPLFYGAFGLGFASLGSGGLMQQSARPVALVIGKYVCPISRALVPLQAKQPLAFIHWPVVVEKCASCGQEHVLQLTDVQHPPVYGYE